MNNLYDPGFMKPVRVIVPLGEARGDEVAALMGRAFQHDPLALYCTRRRVQRGGRGPLRLRPGARDWNLDVIAVEPTRQGRGVEGRLLRAVHARADADGTPVVLLTSQPKNLDLYEHFGCAVVWQGAASTRGPRWWGLRCGPGGSEDRWVHDAEQRSCELWLGSGLVDLGLTPALWRSAPPTGAGW